MWWRYFAIGGEAGPTVMAARIDGDAPCDDREHNIIAKALNECFTDQGLLTYPVGYRERSTVWRAVNAGCAQLDRNASLTDPNPTR